MMTFNHLFGTSCSSRWTTSLLCLVAAVSVWLNLPSGASALYDSNSNVSKLTASQFTSKILDSNDMHLVEFYADWCGHCKNLAPEYELVAKALRGIMSVVAVDDSSVMGQFQVKGFPTIKLILGKHGKAPHVIDYNGRRAAQDILTFAVSNLSKLANFRLSGKNSDPSDSKKDSDSSGSGPSEVVVLTDANFDDEVMNDEKNIWFIKFYAPWCGHCKSMIPDWEKLARDVKGKVKVAKVDVTQESVLGTRFGIKGFPTLYLFPSGKKSDKTAVQYEGPRSSDAFLQYTLQFYGSNAEAIQLTEDAIFTDNCQTGVCVIAFLPDILDSKAEGRNVYLKALNENAKASVNMPVQFFWSQAGDQFDFEESLYLASGYPSMVAVHVEKGKFGVHRGNFTRESINSFLTGLMAGKVPLSELPKLEKLKSVSKWDGKDGVPPEVNYEDEL